MYDAQQQQGPPAPPGPPSRSPAPPPPLTARRVAPCAQWAPTSARGDYSVLVPGLRNTIALDFHLNQSSLYWTDVVEDKIYRGKLLENGALTSFEVVIQYGLATPEGLAVDWIAGNIYWVESNLDQIEVAKLDGTMRTTLLAGDIEHPRAIALDPRYGILFWTDWDASLPRIEAASMSGAGRRTIHKETGSGGWPNGLTVDYLEKRILWIDARSDAIYSALYDGTGHIEVLRGHEYLSHPFAVTLYGGEVYWTDWRTNTLAKANKWTGHNVTVVQRTNTQPFDLQVYHPSRQPLAPNPCEANGGKGPCSHLCLINYNRSLSCACPHLMKLDKDNTTCYGRRGRRKFLLYARQMEIRGVDIDNPYYNYIISFTVPDIDNVTVVDYDALEQRIYWSDVRTQTIKRAFINGTGVETDVVTNGIGRVEGIAVDWIAGGHGAPPRNIYWTDQGFDVIEVARLNGSFRYVVISQGLDKPRAITVHPEKGYLFWTEWGQYPRIERSRLDGTERMVLVNVSISWPNGISVDYEDGKLYWCDARTDKIERIDLESGENREVVLASNNMDMFSVSVFEDYIYWSDRYGAARRWEGGPRTGPGGDGGSAAPWSRSTHANGSIKRGSKDNATESVSLRTGIGVQLKDIKVFNRARQKGRDERSDAAVPAATRCARKAQGTNGPLCPHERATSCAG
uniref:Low-density lipoprotein receptor-related protein 1 n=1 Tax=Nothoprocta perdicaria TaxID=30464 RepID=A0A8C6YMA5_NOTPE